MLKKIMSALLVLACVLTFAACKKNKTSDESGASDIAAYDSADDTSRTDDKEQGSAHVTDNDPNQGEWRELD